MAVYADLNMRCVNDNAARHFTHWLVAQGYDYSRNEADVTIDDIAPEDAITVTDQAVDYGWMTVGNALAAVAEHTIAMDGKS